MKSIVRTFSLILLLAIALPAVGQKKKNKNKVPDLPSISLTDALRLYRFDEAEQWLNYEIEEQAKSGLSTEEAERKLHAVAKARNRMNATERVTFIDSLVVPAETLFQHLKLSSESGKVLPYNTYFNSNSTISSNSTSSSETTSSRESAKYACSVFVSQLENRILFSDTDETGTIGIFSSDLIGNEWTAPTQLEGIDAEDFSPQNYPFMMADGTTLYFAAQGNESLGGYDIFKTRYDIDEHSFLTPENIGMPFNSPANDYLYMVDEFYNLGWFVTDRNQAEGDVCIYTFIPNAVRSIYNTSIYTPDELRSLARLESIRATWLNEQAVQDGLARLAEMGSEATEEKPRNDSESFIMNDNIICHQATDFKSAEARKLYNFWLEGKQQEARQTEKLASLRQEYAIGLKDKVRAEILSHETRLRELLDNLAKQEKEIRRLELQSR